MTFVRDVGREKVVRRLGADPSAGVGMLHHEVWEAQGSNARRSAEPASQGSHQPLSRRPRHDSNVRRTV